jgi:hypothetical protein
MKAVKAYLTGIKGIQGTISEPKNQSPMIRGTMSFGI